LKNEGYASRKFWGSHVGDGFNAQTQNAEMPDIIPAKRIFAWM